MEKEIKPKPKRISYKGPRGEIVYEQLIGNEPDETSEPGNPDDLVKFLRAQEENKREFQPQFGKKRRY